MQYYDSNDYNSRYRGTYIGVQEDDACIPFYVEGTDRRRDNLKFVGYRIKEDGREEGMSTIPVRQENLILHPPKLGLVQSKGTLCYVQRRPHRRWKQGLSLDSCNTRWYVQGREGDPFNVYDLMNRQLTPFEEAIDTVFKVPRRGHAITRSAGVVPSAENEFCHVVFKNRKVGEYYKERGVLVMQRNCEVLQDTLRRVGFQNIN